MSTSSLTINRAFGWAARLVALLLLAAPLQGCNYNGLVAKNQAVNGQWAQVENAYKRRADLIPNLVQTVQGAAKSERQTLTEVMEARARATSVNISADSLTPENLARFQAAQSQLSSGLGRLLAVAENYPDLKTNQNFQNLQATLEGTENRIATERERFNTVVQDYNTDIKSFPNNLTAGMFGFKERAYFQAEAADKEVPKVQF